MNTATELQKTTAALLTQTPLQTCRSQHQAWATSLEQSEDEIDQLLALLADLPSDSFRSLNHPLVGYTQSLNRLKSRIHNLRADVVCTGTSCSSSATTVSCPDPHFVEPSTSSTIISAVSAEYDRMKERCQAFLGELMLLNLI
ncbi:hypothetical protein [Fibrivirga algicola]|uniref:Uncharacterized protein n=1 Tax=Fibrivirga algicola TaxID=2950420 RepID=A0ABX0QF94_9BACT|nr:hypothetical protein [Fibrivirga algicola]NID10692.1 hypothetical protein [Fibrivirga algicola]